MATMIPLGRGGPRTEPTTTLFRRVRVDAVVKRNCLSSQRASMLPLHKTDRKHCCTGTPIPQVFDALLAHSTLLYILTCLYTAVIPTASFHLILGLLDELKVLVEVIPLVEALGLLGGRQDLRGRRQAELLRGGALADEAAGDVGARGLVVVDLARVDVAPDELEPVLVRLVEDLLREGDVVVAAADEGDDVAAAGDLVVLGSELARAMYWTERGGLWLGSGGCGLR